MKIQNPKIGDLVVRDKELYSIENIDANMVGLYKPSFRFQYAKESLEALAKKHNFSEDFACNLIKKISECYPKATIFYAGDLLIAEHPEERINIPLAEI